MEKECKRKDVWRRGGRGEEKLKSGEGDRRREVREGEGADGLKGEWVERGKRE